MSVSAASSEVGLWKAGQAKTAATAGESGDGVAVAGLGSAAAICFRTNPQVRVGQG